LLGVVPLYGWIATLLNRNRLLRWTTLFFASNLLIFYFAGQTGARIGVVYYIWVGIFNVFTVAQLWAFATDLFPWSKEKDFSRYSALERRLERSQGPGLQRD
jgi:AAA family ATP:ADP antiporter